ncbi:hypothetical protein CHUAL_000933 [Chamberlinius hualienensis]
MLRIISFKKVMLILVLFAIAVASLSNTTEPAEMGWNRLFVYGTLKRGEPNYKFMTDGEKGKAVFIGPATTNQKWPLIIASKYNIPFLLYKEGTGNFIEGEVFDVDNALLSTLDALEGHPHFYERLQYDVTIKPEDANATESVHKCWIYILKTFKPSLLNREYYANYSAFGSHGLEYVTSENLNSADDIDEI